MKILQCIIERKVNRVFGHFYFFLQFEDEVSRNFQHVISMIELIWIHETFELNNNLKRLYVLDIFVCISLILKLQKVSAMSMTSGSVNIAIQELQTLCLKKFVG